MGEGNRTWKWEFAPSLAPTTLSAGDEDEAEEEDEAEDDESLGEESGTKIKI